MKNFTKLFCTLMLLCIAGVANASQTVIKTIDYSTATSYPYFRMGAPEGSSYDVVNGVLRIENTVAQTEMYSLQPFIIDQFSVQSGLDYIVRVVYKSTVGGGLWVGFGSWSASVGNYGVSIEATDEFKTLDVEYKEVTFNCNNDAHVLWQMGKLVGVVEIQKVEVIEIAPDDPLAVPKKDLTELLEIAKGQTSFAKTEDSFAALTDVIAEAEAALAAADATPESLTEAKTKLQQAIDALVLTEGYEKLTAAMFLRYGSVNNPGEGTATGCSYDLNKASGLPYGDGNVGELNWADLTQYDKLIIHTVGTVKPRLCMNRLVANGQQAATQEDSKMLDINPNSANTWSTEKYQTIEDGNIFIIDLKAIVADYGFARLHSIKGQGGNVIVTDLLLTVDENPDPLLPAKQALSSAIAKAKLANPFAKTEASFATLTDAIAAAEAAVAAEDATEESLTTAKQAVEEAFAGLELEDGYENLTSDMFFDWTDPENPVALNYATVLYESTGQPYGDPSVYYKNYADLSAYSKLIVVVAEGTPRIILNRAEPIDPEAQGYDKNGGDYVQITDAPVEGIVEVDLTQYDFAHLNAIKGANYQNVTVTDLLLVKAEEVASEATFDFNAMDQATSSNGSNAGDILEDLVLESEGVTLTITPKEEGSNTPNRFWGTNNGPQLRMYSGAMSLVAPEGKAIVKIVIDNAKWNVDNTFNEVAAETGEWEGNAADVQIKIAANTQMNKITVTLADKDESTVTTGISEVKVAEQTEGIFNLAGQRVAKAQKGLYIINGKKVVVK